MKARFILKALVKSLDRDYHTPLRDAYQILTGKQPLTGNQVLTGNAGKSKEQLNAFSDAVTTYNAQFKSLNDYEMSLEAIVDRIQGDFLNESESESAARLLDESPWLSALEYKFACELAANPGNVRKAALVQVLKSIHEASVNGLPEANKGPGAAPPAQPNDSLSAT